MPGLMIIAHAPMASALKAVAEHTYPECSRRLEALDITPGMSIEEGDLQARAMLARVRDPEAIVFTDVVGATPCNIAQRLADGTQVCVIAGVNVPMLWRSLCYRAESLEAVVVRAMTGATSAVVQVASTRPQNQSARTSPCSDDQAKHHHQQ